MGAHDVTGGDADDVGRCQREGTAGYDGEEPLHVVNGEANVARAGPIGNSKPNSLSLPVKTRSNRRGEQGGACGVDLIYDPVELLLRPQEQHVLRAQDVSIRD